MRTLIAIIALCLPLAATAGQVHVYPLTTITSEAGETHTAYLVRVAHWLRSYSDRTGYEACGRLATDGQRYSVAITTSKSHVGCAIANQHVPAGMRPTDMTIHSHGTSRRTAMTPADRAFLGYGQSRTLMYVHGQDTERFSLQDYRGGPGYLAGRDGLYVQHGKGTQTAVVAY